MVFRPVCVCTGSAVRVDVLCLQELQGIEAVENPLRQVGDLVSIQHTK